MGGVGELSSLLAGGGGLAIFIALFYFWFKKNYYRIASEATKDQAEINIVLTLQQEVNSLSTSLSTYIQENSDLKVKIAKLEVVVRETEEFKITINRLREKLNEKDTKYETLLKESTDLIASLRTLVEERNIKIRQLEDENKGFAERIRTLELRLTTDEKYINFICPSSPGHITTTKVRGSVDPTEKGKG